MYLNENNTLFTKITSGDMDLMPAKHDQRRTVSNLRGSSSTKGTFIFFIIYSVVKDKKKHIQPGFISYKNINEIRYGQVY
jgi:hypothetical protein